MNKLNIFLNRIELDLLGVDKPLILVHLTGTMLLILLGFAVGTLGTLIGAGGGFILMPILLLMYPEKTPQELTAISLAVVFFNALSGSITYGIKKRIDYRSTVIFSIVAAPGTVLGVYATGLFPREKFQMLFGVLMGLMAIYLLLPRAPKPIRSEPSDFKYPVRKLIDSTGHIHHISYNTWLGIAISVVVGFLSSLLGIGGGIIHVPALVNLLHFPVHIATATSHSILAIMAGIGTGEHIVHGNLDSSVHVVLMLAVGVIFGAQLGAYLSPKMKDTWIIKALALALLSVAVRFVIF